MSPTVKWIISGILFFAVVYFFYRLSVKDSQKRSSSGSGNTTGGTTGGSGSVRKEEKQ